MNRVASNNILLRPLFWFVFIALVVVALFIYGTQINIGKTELEQTREELKEKVTELNECRIENERNKSELVKSIELSKSQQDTLAIRDNTILEMKEYTKGFGKLTIYSECEDCAGIQVMVDNVYWGTLNYYFTAEPSCGADGTITRFVTAGKHLITGRDRNNNWTWNFYVNVEEGICNFSHYSN